MTVHLVGAGPGDPALVTVRAAELLGKAEVVVYDRLTAAALLDLAPDTAELVNVGKDPSGESVSQTSVNDLLVAHGRAGRNVVRLKGGDPFVFARGAEEAAALAAAGVDYTVVPGITSAFAAPASAGIPVTMRYSSTHVTVVTGHEDPAKGRAEVDWEAIARAGGTIVILMGVGRWNSIAERLVSGGLSSATPAAAVRWGTTERQETTRATLGTLGDHELTPPSTIVVGQVAAQDLNWFERRPLFGRSVVVTRSRAQSSGLAARLTEAGASVILAPTIEIVDPPDGGAALRSAVGTLSACDWVVVTSPNGAERFCAELRDARDLAGVQLAAIGPGTADVLARHHLVVDLMPPRYVAESLLEVFPDPPASGGRVVLPRAEVARDVLPDGLRDRGWAVEIVPAYRTVPVVPGEAELARIAAADAVLFTSSSSADNFVDAMGSAVPGVIGAIGPITAATAVGRGLHVDVVPNDHTLDALVASLADHFGTSDGVPG